MPISRKRKIVDDDEEDLEHQPVSPQSDIEEDDTPSTNYTHPNTPEQFIKTLPHGPFRMFSSKNQEFYTVYAEDAVFLANEFYCTNHILSTSKESSEQYINVRPASLEKLLKFILIDHSRSVEIYSKNQESSKDEWIIVQKGSPGNFRSFENLLFADPSSSQKAGVSLAIQFQQNCIGAAIVDLTSKVISVTEFIDNIQFSDLESFLFQTGSRECLLCLESFAGDEECKERLVSVFEKVNVTPVYVKKCSSEFFSSLFEPVLTQSLADFSITDVESNVEKLTGPIERCLDVLQHKVSLGALACLIKHLELVAAVDSKSLFKIHVSDLSQYLKLDSAAVKALNLFPNSNLSNVISSVSKTSSIYGLFNRCRTAMGSRTLLKWIKQPLREKTLIEFRQNIIEIFFDDTHLRQLLHDQHLKKVPDLEKISRKFRSDKAILKDVVGLYLFTVRLPALLNSLRSYSGKNRDVLENAFINPIGKISDNFSKFEELVEVTIDLKAIDRHEYLVKPDFAPELQEISNSKIRVQNEMDSLRETIAEDLNMEFSKLKLNHSPVHGYHLRVTRKDETKIRGRSEYIRLETRKDGVRFTTRKMNKLNTELQDLEKQYNDIQEEVVKKVTELTKTYITVVEDASQLLSDLDVLVTLAVVAAEAPIPYVRPEILSESSGFLEFRGARHPCMEAQDFTSFIPNDILMDEKSRLQIITGPNMGGKSTYIRTTGVLCLLAQMGSFVPCSSARVSILDRILARVGAGDNQLRGVSTFMAEMLEAASIINSATENSLVIIDELGRGTSTYDGFGLAWAISEYIAKHINAFALFATHFHELTSLASTVKGVVNKHVSARATNETITMLYRVADGHCDQSFGIHVAELAKFPSTVIELARKKAQELENFEGEELGSGKASSLYDSVPSETLGRFLDEFHSLSVENMSDEELVAHVRSLQVKHGLAGL